MSSATVTSPATRGCGGCSGCGSGGTGCSGGCSGAGTGGCSCGGQARAPAGSFVRPRFFAGQVLLDDDLQAIDSYVVGKNRLRNRFLHGDGVVCGLDVTCHPCGGGSVMVGSGYALDCCGNDIVVSCQEEIDVLGMIRDLRTATNGGCDCGPCIPAASEEPSQTGTTSSEPAAPVSTGNPGVTRPHRPQPRRYWLYVRYSEQLSEPIEPYATDAACSPAGCEASRVREGYQFFLRSHRCGHAADDIITRVLDCAGSPTKLMRAIDSGRWASLFADRLNGALRTEEAVLRSRPDDFLRPELSRIRSFATGAAGAPTPDDAPSTSQLIDDLSAAAATVLRAKVLSENDRKSAGLDDAEISGAASALKDAVQKLRDRNALEQLGQLIIPPGNR
jgi:hypothetical protein